MKTIIVTGGIASGKSEICRYLALKGVPVYDSDRRMKELYDEVPGLWNYIVSKFGVSDRKSLAEKIFSDPESRETLESVVYPVLKDDFLNWRDGCTAPFVVMESAVATSKPVFDGIADAVVYVDAGMAERLSRAHRRDHSSDEEILRRMSSQTLQPEKADYIIENNSDLTALRRKVDEIFANFV